MAVEPWVAFLGVALVVVALSDVFLVVLYLRGGAGVVTPSLSSAVWWTMRRIARAFPARKDDVLSFAGPVLLVTIALVWATLVSVGFALIVWPALGTGIEATDGETSTGFATAIYYAASSLTTLGTGDLVPRTAAWRLLMVAKAAMGFSLLTLVVTYFLSVYSALQRRNTFAKSLHQRTASSGSAVEYLVRIGAGGDAPRAREEFDTILRDTVDLYESHQFYPVLHYFRYPQPVYSVARIGFVTLDAYSLLQAALDRDRYHALLTASATRGMWEGAQELLTGLGATFLPDLRPKDQEADPRRVETWRRHLQVARGRLAEEGVELSPAEEAGERYVELRSQWQPWIDAFAEHLAFPPEHVTGEQASDPRERQPRDGSDA